MNKEVLEAHVLHSVESTKNFISSNCNSLKEYLVKKNMEAKNKGCGTKLGSKCTKCMFILLNVFYMLTALLILTAGATGQFAYLSLGLKFEFKFIAISWIISGVVLLFVSIFGIVGACKNSVAWTNIYGVLMIVAFVVQLSAAIVGFTLISKSESIARHTLSRLINSYESFEPSAFSMDFIQKSLQCCGNTSPNDWDRYWRYNSYDNDYDIHTPSSTISPAIRMPASCCASGSGYQNLKCDNYYKKGCLDKTYEITLQVILTIDSVALAVAVAQIVGIVTAFIYAKLIRRTKSYKDVHTLNLQSDEMLNGPTFVDYTHLNDNDQEPLQQVH